MKEENFASLPWHFVTTLTCLKDNNFYRILSKYLYNIFINNLFIRFFIYDKKIYTEQTVIST